MHNVDGAAIVPPARAEVELGARMDALAAPAANRATLQRRDELVASLARMTTAGRVIADEEGRRVYAADAFGEMAVPLAVVLPGTLREVLQVLRFCYEVGIKVVPRGGGTSLVGGTVALADGIVLCLSLMNRVLEVDTANRLVRVEAGATAAAISAAVAGKGFCYAPDPASRLASTIGGNIATNAGGMRALCYGATAQHVLALKLALIDGELIELGGGELDTSGFDLVGLTVGSEGMLGVVVEATLRLVPAPPARGVVLLGFQSTSAAIACAGSLAAGIVPSALEVVDRQVVAVCEAFAQADLPLDVDALLAVEVEGTADEVAALCATVHTLAESYRPFVEIEATDAARMARIWKAFDGAFTALGRVGTVRCVDIAVPPARLAEVMSEIGRIAARHSLRGASLARAGEGIVRSVFFSDRDDPEDDERVGRAMVDVARLTYEFDGVLGGEHGIGVAKRDVLAYRLSAADIALQSRLKTAFDTEWLLNHAKVYPLTVQAS